jgi:hypothetical protein
MTAYPRAEAAGVRKAPRHEIAVGWARRVPLYGDLASGGKFCGRVILHRWRAWRAQLLHHGMGLAQEGDFTFCPICDFNELGWQKERILQLLRYVPGSKLLMA